MVNGWASSSNGRTHPDNDDNDYDEDDDDDDDVPMPDFELDNIIHRTEDPSLRFSIMTEHGLIRSQGTPRFQANLTVNQ